MPDAATPPGRESAARTLLITLAVALVCSLFVSAAAVLLRPHREAERRREREAAVRRILERQPAVAELLAERGEAGIEAHVVDLETGAFVEELDPATYDPLEAAADPERSVPIPPERDLVRLERRERHAPIYLVRGSEGVEVIVLPIRGRGYASVIHGYLALAGDANTVLGITFHEHGETPGIGSEIETDDWRGQWPGKRIRGEDGQVRIRVVDEDTPPEGDSAFRVDAIGGATRSSQGVGNMVRYWMGPDAFGPFLARIGEDP